MEGSRAGVLCVVAGTSMFAAMPRASRALFLLISLSLASASKNVCGSGSQQIGELTHNGDSCRERGGGVHPVESSMKGCGVFSLFPCFTCCTQPPPPPPSAPPLPPPPSAPTAAVIKAVQQTHPAVWTVIIIGGLVATAALLCKRSHPNHSSPFSVAHTHLFLLRSQSLIAFDSKTLSTISYCGASSVGTTSSCDTSRVGRRSSSSTSGCATRCCRGPPQSRA